MRHFDFPGSSSSPYILLATPMFTPYSRIPFRAGSTASRLRGGFTLLECMVAMTCFMVVALAVSAGILQAQRLAQLNVLRTTAYTVA